MYRLNGLLIADQIRASVAVEMRLGRAVLPPMAMDGDNNNKQQEEAVWPPLNFGWTLADVVNNTSRGSNANNSHGQEQQQPGEPTVGGKCVPDGHDGDEESGNDEEEEGGSVADRIRKIWRILFFFRPKFKLIFLINLKCFLAVFIYC